jgi:hypothetical protein
MKSEYEKLISHLDEILRLFSQELKQASFKNKNKWMVKIDSALDDRLRLMKIKDSF